MKISIDAQLFLKGEKTGISWFAHNVLQNLTVDSNHTYQLNCFTLGYSRERLKLVEQYQSYGYAIKKVGVFHDVVYRILWNFIPIPYSTFFGKDSQVSLFFNYIIPPGVHGKKIAVVHDMAYRAYPETVRKRTRRFLELSLEKTCREADQIITISKFSKKEIMRYLSVDGKKIAVVPLGVDRHYYHPNYSEREVQRIKHKYGLDGSYFLYLGTIEPRKNVERLIRAYAAVNRRKKDVPPLILAGKKGWLYEGIYRAVEELHLQDKVKFLGYVTIQDAPKLMKGALAFVFPSLYEGFGLPVLEAMACGTPVITSRAASLPEVAGEAGILVDPLDMEELACAMHRIMEDAALRKQLGEKGVVQAQKFSWKRTAEQIERIIDLF